MPKPKSMKHILTFLFLFCTTISNAQDIIYKKDKTKIEAKVLEIGTTDVKYKSSSNPDGPVYVVPKSEIAIIIYPNGTTDIFSSSENSHSKFDSISINFCRNYIGVDAVEFAGNSVGMIYEHTFGKKGMVALRIPFSVGFGTKNYSGYPNGKVFSTGFDIQYFPTGQGEVRYYAAPYFEWGMFRYSNYIIIDYSYYYPYQYSNGQHLAGGIKNGLLYQPTRHFSFSADFGFGIKKDETSYPNESIQPHFKANVILGYRF